MSRTSEVTRTPQFINQKNDATKINLCVAVIPPRGLFAHIIRPPRGLLEGLCATLLTGRFLLEEVALTLVMDS